MQRTMQRVRTRAGIALVPAILVVSGLAIFAVALLTAVLSGSRTVVRQDEDYKVSSAVESVAALAAEGIWSRYVAQQGGAAGDIASFRNFLATQGITNAGAGGLPEPTAGLDLLGVLGLPQDAGKTRFNEVPIDAVHIVRRDSGDSTQLFLTVSASTPRGEGVVNPVLNRAVQQVYTVEPADFPGFEYALLANNVNCIFCHTRVDNAERVWNTAADKRGSFPRVKVGTLESLVVRHDGDGNASAINDQDADSCLAGSLYARGLASQSNGTLVGDWSALSLRANPFDAEGHLVEDAFGLGLGPFVPAGTPPGPFENLYVGYPLAYADQVDGYLPQAFPPPFPDDGGINPSTGVFDSTGSGNKRVDDNEFNDIATAANGAITAGIVNVTDAGDVIDTMPEYANAVTVGNRDGVDCNGSGIAGNVILTGTASEPIWLNGTLAIDGDLVIQGVVKGSGSIYVRGNIYVPTDVTYADGKTYLAGDSPGNPTGPRTFGIAADGTKNALALTAGGNIMIGDFQRPQSAGTEPGQFDIINGGPTGKWNFPLTEMALFNRSEWAKTQQTLPGVGGTTVQNPGYVAGYVPRYYGYGANTTIPIFNKPASTWFDPHTGTWQGLEAPNAWNTNQLTYAKPSDHTDPILYNANGTPKAVTSAISQTAGWMKPSIYKQSVEYFEGARTQDTPMQIDGLMYTNNAIFSIVYRNTAFSGMMTVNGSIVAADIGMLVPGKRDLANHYPNHSPMSRYAVGLQLNYDQRLRKSLNVKNPFQVRLKRTFWNPTANLL